MHGMGGKFRIKEFLKGDYWEEVRVFGFGVWARLFAL
jgi:hypothetical protein